MDEGKNTRCGTGKATTKREVYLAGMHGTRHCSILVSGRVQGVWFRQSTMERARALGVNGFVENLADGRVHIAAEGRREAVDELVHWSRTGPPKARVDSIEVSDAPLQGFTTFEIRR